MEDKMTQLLEKLQLDKQKEELRAAKIENKISETTLQQAKDTLEIGKQSAALANLQCTVQMFERVSDLATSSRLVNHAAVMKQMEALLRDSLRTARGAYARKAESAQDEE